MTFKEWFFGATSITPGYTNPTVDMQWKWQHILIMLLCAAVIVILALIFRKRSEKARNIVLWSLTGTLIFLEIVYRIKNLSLMILGNMTSFQQVLFALLPRPFCAIACWSIIIATIFKKKYMLNIASIVGLLCTIIYFAYPVAGFNCTYVEFSSIYSVGTHSLILITSITLMTLKFTDFRYKNIWKDLICLGVLFVYAFFEMWVLKIESNPLFMLPLENNDIVQILGVGGALYVVLYFAFIIFFVNLFYLINDRKNVFKKREKVEKKKA